MTFYYQQSKTFHDCYPLNDFSDHTLGVSSLIRMEIEKEGSIGVKARRVLWYLTFSGFAINYIIRVNASIAIVDMIDASYKKSTSNRTIVTSECIVEQNATTLPELSNEINFVDNSKYVSLERRLLDAFGVSHLRQGRVNQCHFIT